MISCVLLLSSCSISKERRQINTAIATYEKSVITLEKAHKAGNIDVIGKESIKILQLMTTLAPLEDSEEWNEKDDKKILELAQRQKAASNINDIK